MQQLIQQLINKKDNITSHTVTIGFDGFIDTIVKLVKEKNNTSRKKEYFNSMTGWGNYILGKSGTNFSVELQQQNTKAGGNMPNMANAMAKLGVNVNCVGALGYPVIDPLFGNLPQQCRLYSFSSPGTCQAIEFDNGKIMLAAMDEINKAGWHTLKERITIKTLIDIFNEASLTGMLNWGELVTSTGIWNGLLTDVLPHCNTNKKRKIFVDLSDCSSRTKAETLIALALLQQFSSYGKVILSLNHNESVFIHNTLFEPVANYNNTKTMGEKLFAELKIDTLLIHNREGAFAFSNDEYAQKDSFIVEAPKLLTGAGDNFNAGFCFAQLMDCSIEHSLLIAHTVSAYYIKNAQSTSWDALVESLKTV